MKEDNEILVEEIKTSTQHAEKNDDQSDLLFKPNTLRIGDHQNKQMGYAALETGISLRDRSYTVDGEKKAKTKKDSKEMSAILNEIEALAEFLESIPFSTEDAESFGASVTALLDRMKHLYQKCEDYLGSKNPWSDEGKARYKLVQKISDRLESDMISLEQKGADYLALSVEEKTRISSWPDFLNWERTQKYEDGSDNVTIQLTGGDTSDVFVIQKNDTRQYFKKEKALRSDNLLFEMDEKENQLIASGEDTTTGTDGYYKLQYFRAFRKEACLDIAMRGATVNAFFKAGASDDPFEDLKNVCKLLGLNPFGDTRKLIKMIEEDLSTEESERARRIVGEEFAKIRKEMVMADIGNNTTLIGEGEDLVKRNVATSRLAKLLGIPDVVTKSEMSSVQIGDEKMYGVVMEEAEGFGTNSLVNGNLPDEYKGQRVTYSPDAVHDLLDMQVLDALCGQTDRHRGNRMVKLSKKQANGKDVYVVDKVTGIDNDMCFGKVNYSKIMSSDYSGIKKVENSHGIAAPAMSMELAQTILALSPAVLEYEMLGILNKKERMALIDRFIGIREAIQRQMDYEKAHTDIPTKFIKNDGWKDFTNNLRQLHKKNPEAAIALVKRSYIEPAMLNGLKIQ